MKIEELDAILRKLEQLCEDIEEDGRSVESIEKAMEDEHFYNLLTSAFIYVAPSMAGRCPKPMHKLSDELAKVIYVYKSYCDSLVDRVCGEVRALLRRVEGCRHTDSHDVDELELFVHSGKVPMNWTEGTGICEKCKKIDKANVARLACCVTRIKKPFVADDFPIQDNSKGMVDSEHTYYYSGIKKYEGEQLRLRIEFTELIIELVKSQKLVE